MQGWIKLHRKIMLHELYNEKPFNRLSAWIDLLMMANHQDKKILFEGNMIDISRGQHITSIRKLCDRWGWSNTKVVKFLDMLKNDEMIAYFSDKKKTLITIDNYGFYQDSNDEETTEKRQRNDTETSLKHTNKNDKNEKNKTHVENFEKLWALYLRKEGKGKISASQKQKIARIPYDEMVRAIERYSAKIAANNTETKYIQMGSTFFNSGYQDYLDENYSNENIPRYKPLQNMDDYDLTNF